MDLFDVTQDPGQLKWTQSMVTLCCKTTVDSQDK